MGHRGTITAYHRNVTVTRYKKAPVPGVENGAVMMIATLDLAAAL
jgi:hypothetical protein